MSQYRERTAVAREFANAVRIHQNDVEETRRDVFLADKLFHRLTLNQLENEGLSEYVANLGAEFLREKKGKTMLERFDLATQERYLGMVHVVELGVTSAPAADGELDGLKDEYAELLGFMLDKKLIDHEMTREESCRTLTVEPTPLTRDLVIVSRNRPLVAAKADIMLDNGDCVAVGVGMAKRMVFSMPTRLYAAIADRYDDPGLESEEAIAYVEGLLEQRHSTIGAIRTGYYLATELA